MKFHFAPLQGYTDAAYRKFHNEIYGGCIDFYYTPFIRIEKGEPRSKDLRDLDISDIDRTKLIPQIIIKDVDEFNQLVNLLSSRGYNKIDINMGCPFSLQVKHGKGAGLLDNPTKIEQIAHSITEYPHIEFSIKMRIGNTENTQWKDIQRIINNTPIKHITLHPRTAKQQYSGQPNIDAFAEFYENTAHPIIYNGDIVSINDISKIVNLFPNLAGVMIGRGLLSRPSLVMEYINDTEMSSIQRMELFLKFHDNLFEYYQHHLHGEAQILNKLKTIWDYNESMIGHKLFKLIKKSSSINKYNQIIDTISELC